MGYSVKNEVVPYELCKQLAEIGFDTPCWWWWDEIGNFYDWDLWSGCVNGKMGKDCYAAPMYQQVFRWFRDKHNLFPNIHSTRSWVNSYKIIYWDDSCDSTTIWDGEKNYKIREEAELACLNNLIEIVKNKQS
jgi:hypothetical protein